MSPRKRSAFSLLEVIAAVIILAIVATATIATVAPMRAKSDQKMDQATLANLNGMAQTFFLEQGRWPTRNGGVRDLASAGYIDTVNNRTAYNDWVRSFEWDSNSNTFRARATTP